MSQNTDKNKETWSMGIDQKNKESGSQDTDKENKKSGSLGADKKNKEADVERQAINRESSIFKDSLQEQSRSMNFPI